MEKSKLKISKLGKVGKMIPALLAAGFLNCASLSAESKYNNYKDAPHIESTSLGSKSVSSYQKIAYKYNTNRSEKTLKNIVNSTLNTMTKYDRLEADVQNEIVGYLADMNANTLELANLYKAMEDNTFASSGMTANEMEKVTKNAANGGGNDQVNVLAARNLMQHFTHLALDTLTLVRFGADEAEITVMDEKDGHNEYLRFRTKGERDLRKETTAVLGIKNDIIDGTRYEYEIKGQNGKQIANTIKNNLDQIETLVSKKNFTENDYQTMAKLINDTADLLPATMFGTQAIRRGLIIEFATSYAMNHTLTVLANLNYDINHFKANAYVKAAKKSTLQANTTKANIAPSKITSNDITFTTSAYSNITNKHAGINMAANAVMNLNNNWDLTVGGEINPSYGALGSTQVLATGELGKTTTEDNRFSFGTKFGVQFDSKGTSVPLGLTAGYNWKISDKLSLDFGINTLLNAQRSYADFGTSVGATYRAKWGLIKFGVGFGYTHEWNKETGTFAPTSTTPEPTPEPEPEPINDEPTYGDDEVIKPAPGTTTDIGNTEDIPDRTIDITRY